MNKEDLQNLVEAAPFFTMAVITRALPRLWALKFGRTLGLYSRFFLRNRVATTTDNLRRAYPDKDQQWVDQQVKQVFAHLGISAVEMLRLDTLSSPEQISKHFTIEGLEHLTKLKDAQQGAFILTAHIGFWESGTAFMPSLGFPAEFVTKTIRNPYVDRFFRQQREASGGKCLDSKHGARRIIKALNNNHLVCLLLDQHISKKRAVIVDFFGRPAYATPIIPQIALKRKTPIIAAFAYRNPDFTYRIVIEPPLTFVDDGQPDIIQRCTQQLTDIIEAAVRKQPDQWFWVHRRWRKSAENK